MTTRIVAVAIRWNGLTLSMPSPARHNDILKRMPARAATTCAPSDQGFLTDTGQFLSREAALYVAKNARQMKTTSTHRELFSEDLW